MHALLPAKDVERLGHGMHAPDPFTFLYVFSAQGMHSCALLVVYPAMHTQSPAAKLPAGANEWIGHAWHAPFDQ